MKLKTLKIIKKEKLPGFANVYDLTVDSVSHYILKDGIISHNSGTMFNPSIILNLYKTALKDENSSKVGINVWCSLEKGRFARTDIKKRMRIRFDKGMNRYFGLESFFDENTLNDIGISKGKYVKSRDEFTFDPSLDPSNFVIKNKETGKVENIKAGDFFTEKIFTQEVLEYLNEKAKREMLYSKKLTDDLDFDDDTNEKEVYEEITD